MPDTKNTEATETKTPSVYSPEQVAALQGAGYSPEKINEMQASGVQPLSDTEGAALADADVSQLEPESSDGRELIVEAILAIVQKQFTIEFHPHGDNNRGMRIWVHAENKSGEEFLTETQLDCEGVALDKVMAIASMKAFRTAVG